MVVFRGRSNGPGLSTEYDLTNVCSGDSNVVARYSPDENLVANGEIVGGKGFLRTEEEEADDAEEKPRSRSVNDGTRGFGSGSVGRGRMGSCWW